MHLSGLSRDWSKSPAPRNVPAILHPQLTASFHEAGAQAIADRPDLWHDWQEHRAEGLTGSIRAATAASDPGRNWTIGSKPRWAL